MIGLWYSARAGYEAISKGARTVDVRVFGRNVLDLRMPITVLSRCVHVKRARERATRGSGNEQIFQDSPENG